MTLILPNDFVNDTTADASPMQQNYSVIEQYVNANVINRDGSVAMAAPLQLVGAPTQPLHAATKSYVDAVLPIGIMMPYGGVAAPGGGTWALCNGSSVAKASYEDLFNVVGYRFGGSGGSFNLPNLTGRTMIGVDPADTETVAGFKIKTVGDSGGTTTPPLLQHQHKIDHNHGIKTSSSVAGSHQHSINHDHASVTSGQEDAGHYHPINTVQNSTPGATGQLMQGSSTGTAVAMNGATESAVHHHAINLPMTTGLLSGPGDLDPHTHTVDLDNYVGNSGNTVQTAGTKYRAPYVTVSFIIRMS